MSITRTDGISKRIMGEIREYFPSLNKDITKYNEYLEIYDEYYDKINFHLVVLKIIFCDQINDINTLKHLLEYLETLKNLKCDEVDPNEMDKILKYN